MPVRADGQPGSCCATLRLESAFPFGIVDRLFAKQGIDPRVVDLANKIKAAQGPEIQQMQSWLRLALPIGFRKDV
jgi:hypothetical protein